ncbi:uncharacterized protein C8Q71DRAFT_725907 [Rhodofomes roseus]|uniref:Uncharacterized protein n=1 Tax=Rhodofomes roseus TaxID=34475 RepID=A0ABQ8K939_9APHY|nr:uncharacterized protein C8Q71DRAFT_725905 [Rhodofomes roseus]XP_047776032.1 uncharacterized protein C8Q71DRAFT_725907 [Rhodofomes roseus]KAH9833264.1 hypothetical protein C8Q71DRAFT_725905 [Rhodofomes roseus]KAH9833266.1 hypothetical protein C8Q71DRAFT_725907 [Rhodofomes roseus]
MPNVRVEPTAEAHIARYYRLIEVIKGEAAVEPRLLPVSRGEWLSWANCVFCRLRRPGIDPHQLFQRGLFESYCKAVTDDPNSVPSPYSFNDVVEVMNYIDEIFQRYKLPHDSLGAPYPTIAWSEESVLHREAIDEPLAPVSYQLDPLYVPEYRRLPDNFNHLANAVHRLSEDQQEIRRILGSLSTSVAELGGRERGINVGEPVRDAAGRRGGFRGRGRNTGPFGGRDFR